MKKLDIFKIERGQALWSKTNPVAVTWILLNIIDEGNDEYRVVLLNAQAHAVGIICNEDSGNRINLSPETVEMSMTNDFFESAQYKKG